MKIIILAFLFYSNIAIASEKHLWLEAHNVERKSVGVNDLIWSSELEAIAKKWAMILTKDCNKIILRHQQNIGDIGENIAGSSGREHPVSLPVQWWIKEKQWYSYAKNECNAPANKSCLHYRQVVSKRSKELGCAKVNRCPGNKTIYVCNYRPHGNMNIGTTRPY